MSGNTEKLFSDINQFITESQTLLKQGAIMELSGLDDQVRTLSDEVLKLSQDDRVRNAEKLQQVLAALKQLGDDMVQHREALGKEIRHLSSYHKANVAYRTTEAIDVKKEEK